MIGGENSRKPVFGFRLLEERLFCKGLCLFETVVGTGLGFEQPAPCGFKCAVDGDAADLIAAGQGGDAFLPLRVGQPNGLSVVRGEAGVFVHVHVSILLKYCKQR